MVDYQSKISEWEAIKGNVVSLVDSCMECGNLRNKVCVEIKELCVNYAPIDGGVIENMDMKLEDIHSRLVYVIRVCEEKINYYRQMLAELEKKKMQEVEE